MRTLAATLSAKQKEAVISPLYRIVLTLDAATTTYNQDRILSIDHSEEPYHQQAEVVLDNSDRLVTTNFKGYQGVISYGMLTSAGEERSSCAPLFVMGQQNHSSRGLLTVTLSLVGLPDLLAEDKANVQQVPTSADLNTPKDFITQIVKGVLPVWAATTVYALDDLVKPIAANAFAYKCTTAGTSAGGEPVFPTTIGATVADNTVVWTNQGIEITAFSHCVAYTPTFDSEDSLLDVVTPADAFDINLNDTRLFAIQRLLYFTRSVMRSEANGAFHFLAPTVDGDTWVALTAYTVNEYAEPTVVNNTFAFRCTTAGTTGAAEPTWPTVAGGTVTDGTVVWTAIDFDYEYRVNVAAQHELFAKSTRNRTSFPNFISVKSNPASDDSFSGTAEDVDSSNITNMEKREHYYMRLVSNAQATSIAKAILQTYRLRAQRGAALVPINVGQEVYDYVKFTDSRQDDVRTGNVGSLQRTAGNGRWEMQIAFGEARTGGYLGLLPPVEAAQEVGPVSDIPSLIDQFNSTIATLNQTDHGITGALQGIYDSVDALRRDMTEVQRRMADWETSGVSDILRGSGGADLIIRGNYAATDATSRSIVLQTLDAATNTFYEALKLVTNGTIPRVKAGAGNTITPNANTVLSAHGGVITDIAAIVSNAGGSGRYVVGGSANAIEGALEYEIDAATWHFYTLAIERLSLTASLFSFKQAMTIETTTGVLTLNPASAGGAVVIQGNSLERFRSNPTGLSFFGATPVAQQVSGANLTNNVTAGGVNDTIADFTDLATYANDAAAIRNDIYQLARKLKQVNDALRLYGILT